MRRRGTPDRAWTAGGRGGPQRPRTRRGRRSLARAAAGATVLAVLSIAAPVGAHPFVRGGEVAVDSLARVTLEMAHGCGTEQAGGGDPTQHVALEVPDEARIVDVPTPDGWQVELERDADARVVVVTWTATTAEEPAPVLAFDVVFTGQVGGEVYLRVLQACDGFTYRWIGTPDEPASDPAVRVRLVEPDPQAPPPPAPEVPVAEEPAIASAAEEDPDALEVAPGGEALIDDASGQPDAQGPGWALVLAAAIAVGLVVIGGWRWVRTGRT